MVRQEDDSITLRPASAEDAGTVLELVESLRSDLGLEHDLDLEDVAAFLEADGAEALLASVGGEPVGLLSLIRVPSLFHARPSLRIDALVVAPSARRLGVARRLLAAAVAAAHRLGCAEVEVSTLDDNLPAQALYESMGFEGEARLFERHLSPGGA